MYVACIFCFKQDAPIENWLQNSVESLAGNTVNLPTDWRLDMAYIFSLAVERIEKERLAIPVEALQFWEQSDFKALMKETVTRRTANSRNRIHFVGNV